MAQFTLDLPIKHGLQASYDALEPKDTTTLYITTNTKKIYFGEIELSGSVEATNPIVSVLFDEDSQVFTFKYLDSTEYKVDLVLESVIQSFVYDPETHICTVTTVNGITSQIDLTDLIGAYNGGDTQTTSTSVDAGTITVDVKVSDDENNALEVKEDGLFVPKPVSIQTENTNSVETSYIDGKISANVKVSAVEDNVIETNDDGLYVSSPKAVIGTF